MAGFVYNFIIFATGLAVGSFLNVVIFRLENGEKIINDRSKCLKCKHILKWYDLVPVLSFVFLKGKCRYCGEKISWQYPIVELATGILFIMALNFQFSISNFQSIFNFQFLIPIFYYSFIISALIVIFVYDLKHYIIPDKIIYPAIVATLGFGLFRDFVLNYKIQVTSNNFQFSIFNSQSIFNFQFLIYNLSNSVFVNHLLAAFISCAFFYSIVVLTRGKGMGGGDVKLGFLMGTILGWSAILLAVFSSFIFGSIAGLCLIAMGKKKMKSMIPFGPFLVLGTLIAMFWGEGIARWYFRLMD